MGYSYHGLVVPWTIHTTKDFSYHHWSIHTIRAMDYSCHHRTFYAIFSYHSYHVYVSYWHCPLGVCLSIVCHTFQNSDSAIATGCCRNMMILPHSSFIFFFGAVLGSINDTCIMIRIMIQKNVSNIKYQDTLL